jgi:carbamoyltransferase
MKLLGLSAFGRDAAAALVVDGVVVAAMAEDRFSRVRHDASFPRRAARACLRAGGLEARDLDAVVFHVKPLRQFERVLACQLRAFPRSAGTFARSLSTWLGDRLWLRGRIAGDLGLPPDKVLFCEHHAAHAAAAYLPSPFDEAAVLVVDGAGEWAVTSLWHGRGGALTPLGEIHFPHSPALLYSAVTEYLGFPPGGGEQRVVQLAALGAPRFLPWLNELVSWGEDGSLRIDQRPFRFAFDGERLFARAFEERLGPARAPGAPLRVAREDARDADLAASVQRLAEEALLRLAATLHARAPCEALCLGGELAMNQRAVARLLRDGPFRRLWVPPAPGDDGAALGAALLVAAALDPGAANGRRWRQVRPFLGEAPDTSELPGTPLAGDDAVLAALLAHLQRDGLVGWVRGAFEWGPRALGHRSLLADPRGPQARERVNAAVKRRESFRPYSAVVPAERAADYFELPDGAEWPLRWMQLTLRARPRATERAPAVVHVDGTARAQLVHAAEDPLLHRLLLEWDRLTGAPVLLHTSLNLRGDPPVRSAEDAKVLWERSGLQAVVVGDRLLERSPDGLAPRANLG